MAAEAQARTDEEITKHILSLCNLRTRRNTFSLISRLPTETLAAVFVHYARDYSKHGDCPPRLCLVGSTFLTLLGLEPCFDVNAGLTARVH
jgi:hypothetical protein